MAVGCAANMHPVSKAAYGTVPLRRALRFAAAALLGILPVLVGCSTRCPHDDKATVYDDGATDPNGTVYESGPVKGPFLYYPGGRIYELVHHLRGAPQEVKTYVAFNEDGAFSESAGNQTVIREVTDTYVKVDNDTCADFYLRVVAHWWDFSDGGAESDAGVSDAGAEDANAAD